MTSGTTHILISASILCGNSTSGIQALQKGKMFYSVQQDGEEAGASYPHLNGSAAGFLTVVYNVRAVNEAL